MSILLILLASGCYASVRNMNFPLGGDRLVIAINSATDFCMFLPPKLNETIAMSEGYPFASPEESESWAVSHCTQS